VHLRGEATNRTDHDGKGESRPARPERRGQGKPWGKACTAPCWGTRISLTPQPSLATYRAVLDELKEANVDALDRGRRACARKRAAVAAFDKATARLAAYVNSVALG
jgi:hypothetical protein